VIPRVGIRLVVLGSQEIRQHLAIAPARIAGRRPVIEIGWMATEIDHAVDGARPTHHMPARDGNRAACQVLLGYGHEPPVEVVLADCRSHRRRNVDERMSVHGSGLDQGDSLITILRKAGGEHTTCSACPHYYIVERVPLLCHDANLLTQVRVATTHWGG